MSKISDEIRKISDEIRKISDEIRKITERYRDWWIKPYKELNDLADRIDAEMVELPRDRDGVPIRVGDTVYLDNGRKAKVARIQLSERENSIGFTVCGDFFALWPEDLTHTAPDSWERIAEELEAWCDRTDVDGDACGKPRDLAKRIRRLAEREGEQ